MIQNDNKYVNSNNTDNINIPSIRYITVREYVEKS